MKKATSPNNNIKSYVSLTEERLNYLLGDITVESLFSGYGFYHKGEDMFGIAQSGIFYVRAQGDLATYLVKNGAFICSDRKGNKALSLSFYYGIPLKIMEDDALYKSVLLQVIQQIQEEKLDSKLSQKKSLKDLVNLELKHERILKKVNITSVIELRGLGAEAAYIRLKKAGLDITIAFYWSLVGALKNTLVTLLTKEQRKEALEKLNVRLKKEKMRAEKG